MSERFAPQLKLAGNPRLTEYLAGRIVMPINLEISPAGACNAKCPWCFYRGVRDVKQLSHAVMLKVLSEMRAAGILAVTWTGGGEPTMNVAFGAISRAAWLYGMKQGLITNGMLVNYNPSDFQWIRVSLTEKAWQVDNLKKLRACPVLGLNINYTGNVDEIKSSLKVAYDVGADYVEIRPALRCNGETTDIEEPEIDDPKLKKIGYKFVDAKSAVRSYTRCQGYHFVPFIWQDGEVEVCAYHRGSAAHRLGNIYADSLITICQNMPAFVSVTPDCQVCCKNHEINKLINGIQNLTDTEFV
jgi:MoaA/NifB/PqqE/SkfB family radical SAM enzyme